MFIKVSYTFLYSNSICHKCSALAPGPGPHGDGGNRGVMVLFSICQDDITSFFFSFFLFSPHKGGTTEAWWNTVET